MASASTMESSTSIQAQQVSRLTAEYERGLSSGTPCVLMLVCSSPGVTAAIACRPSALQVAKDCCHTPFTQQGQPGQKYQWSDGELVIIGTFLFALTRPANAAVAFLGPELARHASVASTWARIKTLVVWISRQTLTVCACHCRQTLQCCLVIWSASLLWTLRPLLELQPASLIKGQLCTDVNLFRRRPGSRRVCQCKMILPHACAQIARKGVLEAV